VRLLWSLPKAAPALLRHMAAYVDLAALDLARAQREISAQFVASAVVVICGLFAVLLACLAVVACTWDTPYRVSAIAWMGGIFVVFAIVAALYRSKVVRARSELFATVRREWREDRVLLERVLSSDQGPSV
jgi:uncharacterized membrane protein YqjE